MSGKSSRRKERILSAISGTKIIYSFFLTLFLSSMVISGFAYVNVGLKEDDWVEYTVAYTGSPSDTYTKTARIKVKAIQGTLITVETQRTLLNGTQTSQTETFDLEDGAPNLIAIPANLTQGDEIHHKDYGAGGITLQAVENYSLEGTTRQLIYAVPMPQTRYGWDRTTGILVEYKKVYGTFIQNWTATKSSIIQTPDQPAQTPDQTPDPTQFFDIYAILPYLAIIAITIILAVIALFIFRRMRSLSPL